MIAVALALGCAPGTARLDRPTDAPATGETGAAPSTGDTGLPPTLPPARPPNLLILLADDLGTDKVGVYAEHPLPPPTPRLDALAAEGVLFRNAWATPVCSSTRTALLTGRTGRRTGLGDVIQTSQPLEVPIGEFILPELLRQAPTPYADAAVGKWHLAGYRSTHGLDHPIALGFDRFVGTMGNLYDFMEFDGRKHGYYHWEKVEDGVMTKVYAYQTSVTVDDALALASTLPEPWLLYVAFAAPHKPLDVPPDGLHSFGPLDPDAPDARLYHAVVEAMDTEIGRLLDGLGDEVRERTTVVFLGDNGTPDHAILPPLDPKRGKMSMFEGGLNVPLIVAGAGVAAPGRESAALVHVTDLFATFAGLAGVPLSGPGAPPELADRPLDSVSFLPVLADPAADGGRTHVHGERFLPVGPPPYWLDRRATRDDRFKVIEAVGPLPPQVFDLQGRVDDGEPIDLRTLSAADRAQVDALLAAHEAYWASIPPVALP